MLNDIYHALDPIAFTIGPVVVHWYGLGYIIGILIGLFVIRRTVRRWKLDISFDSVLTVIIASTFGIILGGRIGYILFYNLEFYIANPDQLLALSNGGMSFHGGFIGMVIAMLISSRLTRVPLTTLGDLVCIAAPPGLFLVRCANFINGELWGAVTDLPWGVVFDNGGPSPRHPSQLYEAALEGLVLFIVLQILSRKRPPFPQGAYIGAFMVLYGIFRIAVEQVREPDAQLGYLMGTDWLTMGTVLSTPLVLVGLCFLLYAAIRRKPQRGKSR
jgi:phosphatidylglycerol:prolipoprotein diacylglycerol transferase